ncbi:MAG: S-adenosylmethionine-dependent methyltransferase [Alphaproteobacteria bacterium]|nr:MAG: S-adenosylmethionine-dependent methyltransferase [Alphaproteobacteria bacterium]
MATRPPADDRWDAVRPGEVVAALPERIDAGLVFIGRVRTPFVDRDACPRRGALDGPLCRLEVDPPWHPALTGITVGMDLEVLYWMHLARRDLVLQSPRHDATRYGTFALRSPVRPNPIAKSIVRVEAIELGCLQVRGLDCVDGTPLLDLKPDRAQFQPKAPPSPGEAP